MLRQGDTMKLRKGSSPDILSILCPDIEIWVYQFLEFEVLGGYFRGCFVFLKIILHGVFTGHHLSYYYRIRI